ncbi:MAG: hypothetical protein ACI81L_001124 [Verrucomicrobiales bacterium]|jgi:hypothetical protein
MMFKRVLVLVGAIFMVGCGSSSPDASAIESAASSILSETTVAPTTQVATTVMESPTTSEVSVAVPDEVDPQVARNSKTWQEYTNLVSPGDALKCALAWDWFNRTYTFANRTGLSDRLIERAATLADWVYDPQRSDVENDEAVAEAFDGLEMVALVSDVETWLHQRIAILRLAIEANTGRAEFSDEGLRREEQQLLDLVAAAELAGPTGEIDIRSALQPVFQSPSEVFKAPPSCPMGNDRTLGGRWRTLRATTRALAAAGEMLAADA